ncbi:MAG: hypothetical protein GY946_04920 [bacterium]|nr:hypothetical protein [bacterium]
MLSRLMEERSHFADAMDLRADGSVQSGAKIKGSFKAHGENLSWRFSQRFIGQITGEGLSIKYDRDAGGGQVNPDIPGEDETASWVEVALDRAVYETDLEHEITALGKSICAYGNGALVQGYDSDVSTAASNEAASITPLEAIEAAAQGDLSAVSGADHQRIQAALRDAAANSQEVNDQQRAWLLAKAQAHDAMQEKDAKNAPEIKRITRQEAWIRFMQPGIEVAWDSSVVDPRDTSWRARRVYVKLEDFRRSPRYTAKARKEATGSGSLFGTMLDTDSKANRESPEHSFEQIDKYVETWEVFRLAPSTIAGLERLIATPELPEMWIHESKDFPFVRDDIRTTEGGVEYEGPDHGRNSLPGMWPILICAPILPVKRTPERTGGLPLLAPGWPQQMETDQLASIDMGSAKKGLRYVILEAMFGESEEGQTMLEKIRRGESDWACVAPSGVKPEQMEKLFAVLDFKGGKQDLGGLRAATRAVWAQIQGMPQSSLQMVGTGDTATQDTLSVAAGDAELDIVISQVEKTVSTAVLGMAGIMRDYYGEEKIRRMLGTIGSERVKQWSMSSLDGDKIVVGLGRNAIKRDAVDREQLIKSVELVQGIVDPVGAPIWDVEPLVEDLFRVLGRGKPKRLQTDSKDPRYAVVLEKLSEIGQAVEQLIKRTDNLAKQSGGSPGAGAPSDGTPGPEGGIDPSIAPPTAGTLAAGARRDTVPSGV